MSSRAKISERVLDGPHGPLRVRVYTPASAAGPGLVWAHGGGFAGGDLDMPEAHWVSSSFAARGITVVSVEYRLAPVSADGAVRLRSDLRGGARYPVPHDEVVFAFRWAVASGLAVDPWAIGGASAGGNLATGAALRLADDVHAVPALAVLAYPTLHAVQGPMDATLRDLLDANPDADRFGPDVVLGMYENYLGGPASDADIYALPGTATAAELAAFPPTIIINDETDELRVSGEAFALTLAEAGVDIDISTEPGTTHGHLNRPEETAATASIDRFAERILALAPDTKEQP